MGEFPGQQIFSPFLIAGIFFFFFTPGLTLREPKQNRTADIAGCISHRPQTGSRRNVQLVMFGSVKSVQLFYARAFWDDISVGSMPNLLS